MPNNKPFSDSGFRPRNTLGNRTIGLSTGTHHTYSHRSPRVPREDTWLSMTADAPRPRRYSLALDSRDSDGVGERAHKRAKIAHSSPIRNSMTETLVDLLEDHEDLFAVDARRAGASADPAARDWLRSQSNGRDKRPVLDISDEHASIPIKNHEPRLHARKSREVISLERDDSLTRGIHREASPDLVSAGLDLRNAHKRSSMPEALVPSETESHLRRPGAAFDRARYSGEWHHMLGSDSKRQRHKRLPSFPMPETASSLTGKQSSSQADSQTSKGITASVVNSDRRQESASVTSRFFQDSKQCPTRIRSRVQNCDSNQTIARKSSEDELSGPSTIRSSLHARENQPRENIPMPIPRATHPSNFKKRQRTEATKFSDYISDSEPELTVVTNFPRRRDLEGSSVPSGSGPKLRTIRWEESDHDTPDAITTTKGTLRHSTPSTATNEHTLPQQVAGHVTEATPSVVGRASLSPQRTPGPEDQSYGDTTSSTPADKLGSSIDTRASKASSPVRQNSASEVEINKGRLIKNPATSASISNNTLRDTTRTKSPVLAADGSKSRKDIVPEPLPKAWLQPLTWPFEGIKRVTVSFEDLHRLNEEEFLNDSIVNFCLRRLELDHQGTTESTYFFNTYFYDALTKLPSGRAGFNYDAVKSWTRKVNLFSYDHVIIPVNRNFHWYLFIVSNLPALLPSNEAENEPLPEQPDGSAELLAKTDADRMLSSDKADARFGNKGVQIADLDMDKMSLERKTGGEEARPHSAIDSYSQGVFKVPDSDDDTRLRRLRNRSIKPPWIPTLSPKDPIVVALDSMGGEHGVEIRNIKRYLVREAAERKSCEISVRDITGTTAKGVPTQANATDCGIFLIGYVSEFLKHPRQFVEKVCSREMDDTNSFQNFDPSQQRRNIRRDIISLEKEQKRRRILARKQKRKMEADDSNDGAHNEKQAVTGKGIPVSANSVGISAEAADESSPERFTATQDDASVIEVVESQPQLDSKVPSEIKSTSPTSNAHQSKLDSTEVHDDEETAGKPLTTRISSMLNGINDYAALAR
ncbi:hypothetical protein ANO11243_019540 [Dothideomycetidae sp. 11243]|nr:hypothetical protein ANO11243_019540 [fungal sp. No.11243]